VFEMIQGRLLLLDEGVANLCGMLRELAGADRSAQCDNSDGRRTVRVR
jgi:hypothetical protein